MPNTIANVLSGVAVLEVATPDQQRAEWSTEQAQTGDYSVKLSKMDTTMNYQSTHVQFTPIGAAAAITMLEFETMAGAWTWDHFRVGPVGTYWEQLELRFEDPDTDAWVDITVQVNVAAIGAEEWVTITLADTNLCFHGGWSEGAGSFSNWATVAISTVTGAVETSENAAGGIIANADSWLLTRIKMECWESSTEHYVYVDQVQVESVMHTLEPGNATPGLRLSSVFTEVGYTEDGVTLNYTGDTIDVDVDEETFPIDSLLKKETCEVVCNMAESSLFNIDKAMAGSILSGAVLSLGGGVNKKLSLQIRSTNPASYIRAIQMASCVATGTVGQSYKKGEKTIVPVTFRALKTTGHPAVRMVDNAA